ncbi:MAG: DUF3455 domain-containing protein [Betaproteobacteria bacterium]|nr:DUF3455 domain-containing protein [Betaproteobacteria bacterium]
MSKKLRNSAFLLPLALAACAAAMQAPEAPQAVTPPAGSKYSMTAVGIGEITYECRAKAGAADAFEWVFVAPVATLYDGNKKVVGKYYGGPTWEANDGSKVTGKQLAVAPATGTGNIPLQLVQANPAMGSGAMTDVTYIQRLNTMGGVAPAAPCAKANAGAKQQVKYQADYVFYKK